jgi:hypothetical protein
VVFDGVVTRPWKVGQVERGEQQIELRLFPSAVNQPSAASIRETY